MTSSCNFVVVVIVLLFHLVRPSPSFVFGVTENINNEEKKGNGEGCQDAQD